MKAVIAGTAGVAVPLVLQGCGKNDDVTTMACEGLDAQACITNNSSGNCHWDPETQEENCELVEDYDDALFELTENIIQFSNPPAEDEERETAVGCEDYEAVPARRAYAKCEHFPEYKMQKGGELSDNIRFDNMKAGTADDQTRDFLSKEVVFYLPQIAADDVELRPQNTNNPDRPIDPEWSYGDIVNNSDLGLGALDWTPFGDAALAGADSRLQCSGWLSELSVRIDQVWGSDDPRIAEDAPYMLYFFPNVNDERPRQFKCGGQTVEEWQAEADQKGFQNARQYWESRFDKKEQGFGLRAWDRFQMLSRLSTKNDSIEIVQADLEANKFYDAEAFMQCNGDRNCGMDYTEHKCIEVEEFCAQFEVSDCPEDIQEDMIPVLVPDEKYGSQDLETEDEDVVRELVFSGTAFYHGTHQVEVDGELVEMTPAKSKCAAILEDEDGVELGDRASCAVHQEFISCDTIGVPGSWEEGQGVGYAQVYADPLEWDFDLYSAYDLTTFATYWVIETEEPAVATELNTNPRGCFYPAIDPLPEGYEAGATMYPEPVCTLPYKFDCIVETIADEETEDTDGDGDDTETAEAVAAELESAEKCVLHVEGICQYNAPSNGECVMASDYYAKYFDDATGDALYESVVVTMKPVEEELEEEEDLDAAGESGDGVQDEGDENAESSFVEGVRA